jgi:hypothetical protein
MLIAFGWPYLSSATPALAAGSAAIELVGGTAPRSIPLSVLAQPPKQVGGREEPIIQGKLQLTLRNKSRQSQRVQVLLASNQLPGPNLLQKATLAPSALRDIVLTVQVPRGQEPSALNGTMIAEASAPKAKQPAEQFKLPVTASIQSIGDVRFAPSTAVVQVTRWCLFFPCNTQDGGTVELYGSGVDSLLAQLSAAHQESLRTKLRAGSNLLDAELIELRPDPVRPGVATARLHLGEKPTAGNYKGSIAVSPLLPQAPALTIDVNSRYMFLWAVVMIFLGVLASGYFYQQLGLSRRKRLLREMLLDTVNVEYCPATSQNEIDGPQGTTNLTWSLAIKCPLEDNPAWTYYTDLTKSYDIYTAVYWARNDADLDEAQAAALTLVHGIKTWQLALADVRGLWELAEEPRAQAEKWSRIKTAQDTRLLLRKAQHNPGDAAKSSELLEKIKQQTSWHRAFAEAWDLRTRLIEAGGEVATDASEIDLAKLDEDAKPVLTRTNDEQDQLELDLEQLYTKLVDIAERSNADPLTAEVDIPTISDGERELEAERLRSELSWLEADTPLAYARIGAARALTTTSENGHKAQAAAGAENGAGSTAKQKDSRPPAPPTSNRAVGVLRRLQLVDGLMSIAILVVTSVLYAVTIYGPTWGSISDWATAFGAGFTGHVVVKWALLPIYRSLRVRAESTSKQQAADGAGASA